MPRVDIYILNGEAQADLGTKILMMAIGLMQLVLQLLGIWYVRGYKWIEMHSAMMTYMFYMSGVLIAMCARAHTATQRPAWGGGELGRARAMPLALPLTYARTGRRHAAHPRSTVGDVRAPMPACCSLHR